MMVRKMTKAEAGRLGAAKSRKTIKANVQKRVTLYDAAPSICKNCDAPIPYVRRTNTFCGSSCSAIYNNTGVRRHGAAPVEWECLHCGKSRNFVRHTKNRFCNHACHKEYMYEARVSNWLTGGSIKWTSSAPPWIRRYLTETHGHECSVCSITEWNNKPIVFDVDHIDGNSLNNKPENLRLLCQNCHGQTPTYGIKNKGNGRHARRIRYNSGKSY